MIYKVFEACPELQSFVKCFWTLSDDHSPELVKQRVIPDGCMEMIFHYEDPYCQYFDDGRTIIQPRSFIFGQISSFIEIAPTGKTGLVAARFLPEGLAPFLRIPVTDLDNKAIALSELFGVEGIDLEKAVIDAADNHYRIDLIQQFLLSRLTDPTTIDTITQACVASILKCGGQLDIAELTTELSVHRRNLERKFAKNVGMSPKQLSKLVRLQAVLKKVEQNNSATLTSLAHDAGYYDQAHFIKDFKEIIGMNPGSFFADNLKLSALFISDGE